MKNSSMKLFLTVCLFSMTISTFAQFANQNQGSASKVSTVGGAVDTEGWERITVSYNPMKFINDDNDSDDLTGFSLGYYKGFSISQSYPLFLESGANILYASRTDDVFDDFEFKSSFVSLNIPLNVVYKFELPNSNINILPYVGINFKGNIIGQSKIFFTGDLDDYGYDSEKELWEDYEDSEGKRTISYFNKDDVDKDALFNRFQVGWQIGIGLTSNQLYLGVGYGKDMSELAKDLKTSTTSLTVGYNF